MKVLIACEYSGTVRDAFIRRGIDAISCDILPTESPGPHHQGDIMDALDWKSGGYFDFLEHKKFDLVIAHPPCTALSLSGNGTYGKTKEKHKMREDAIAWTLKLWKACKEHSLRVCFENPTSVIFQHLEGGQTQYIQPHMFGHKEQKKTGLCLYNLPELRPTRDAYEEMMLLPKKERERIHYMSPGKNRGKARSLFYRGIADAMAQQWGEIL